MYISNQGMLKERRTRDNERVRKENHVRAVKWNGIQRSCKIFGFVPVQRVGIYLETKEEDKKRNLQQKGLRILKCSITGSTFLFFRRHSTAPCTCTVCCITGTTFLFFEGTVQPRAHAQCVL